MPREEMKVFYLHRQLCIYRDKEGEGVQHGRTGVKGSNWSHELAVWSLQGFGPLHGEGTSWHIDSILG